ncbi:MAG: hypothetical protein ACE5HD_03685 [Acidobacteriota bacterium]
MREKRWLGVALGAAVLLGALLGAAPPRQTERHRHPPLEWRVAEGVEGLEPAAPVRVLVADSIPISAVNERYGLVQSVVYLYHHRQPGADRIDGVAQRSGLTLTRAGPETQDPVLSGEMRVSLEIPGMEDDDYAVGIFLGRPVKVNGVPETRVDGVESDTIQPGALRVDQDDLEDRRRWAPDTLILPGQERIVWEGTLPLRVDRIYADYLAIRAGSRNGSSAPERRGVRLDTPEGGILDIPPTLTPKSGLERLVSTGVAVVRPEGARLRSIKLLQGHLNLIRIEAALDATGGYGIEVTLETEPLPPPGEGL